MASSSSPPLLSSAYYTATSPESVKPILPPQPLMVHVTAPATLPAGYTFEAAINDDESRIIHVEVPAGGVQKGQILLTPLPSNYTGPRLVAPTGEWKDGLLDCCAAGACHPSLWCSVCCPQLAMAQVITRMQLNWCGQPDTYMAHSHAFAAIFLLFVAYLVYSLALEGAELLAYNHHTTTTTDAFHLQDPSTYPYLTILRWSGNALFTVWSVWALCCTRRNVRARYRIPPRKHCNNACEDVCCAVGCSCCITAQMLRHTGEYEVYPGVCCSKTGHPPGTPLVI